MCDLNGEVPVPCQGRLGGLSQGGAGVLGPQGKGDPELNQP